MEEFYKKIASEYPFLSFVTYGGNEYVGIVQNSDDVVTTIYDYTALRTITQKAVFLDLAEQWWYESNRQIPINVFLKGEWSEFRICIKTFASKDVEIVHGPRLSLKDIAQKRSKRKSITLVKKVV